MRRTHPVQGHIRAGDQLIKDVSNYASIKLCTNASFEAQLRPLVQTRATYGSISKGHQCSFEDIPFDEYDQLIMMVPVDLIFHSNTEPFDSLSTASESSLFWRERAASAFARCIRGKL